MVEQLNTCPCRAPNKLFLQEATRPFTRTCTRPAAHKSCCRMAYDCLSGGECPPPAKRTTPTRHLRNDTFRNGKPSILHRVNVRVNVCYLKVILILKQWQHSPEHSPDVECIIFHSETYHFAQGVSDLRVGRAIAIYRQAGQ